jgi:predicted RNA binding protein YcfA (HicA-like mRNA interferase family)
MPKLSPAKPRVIIKFLKKQGFIEIRQKGSHIFFEHNDGRSTVVANHPAKEIRPSLLRKILNDIEVSPDEFMRKK